jgi:hypothetical protein
VQLQNWRVVLVQKCNVLDMHWTVKKIQMNTTSANDPTAWQRISACIARGHQVASGTNGNPKFPGGTLQMQAPFFRSLGLDLSVYHLGTLNVNISPSRYRVVAPRLTLPQVKWHPLDPAEDFSFFDVRLIGLDSTIVNGLIYYPHPETKPTHLQPPDMLELLLPFVPNLAYGSKIQLEVPMSQMVIDAGPSSS